MSKNSTEHALALVKASISAIPCVGGPIASLINDYIPDATQRSVTRTMDLLAEQLEEIKDRIDPEAVNRDEFSELFKSCYLTIVRTHQESKLQAAASLIANILLQDGDSEKLSYNELDHFVRCLDSLSIGAIEVLASTIKYARLRHPRKVGRKNVRVDFGHVRGYIPGEMAPDLLMGLYEELNSFHLIHLIGSPGVRESARQSTAITRWKFRPSVFALQKTCCRSKRRQGMRHNDGVIWT